MSHNFSLAQYIQDICKKVGRVLGMIIIPKNTHDPLAILRLYTALVCPHLESDTVTGDCVTCHPEGSSG